MRLRGIFFDERRDRIRLKTKVGFLEDYFLRSEVTDYQQLRWLLNGFIGLLVCSTIYYMGWKRLNFADFHPVYGVLFKWAMILIIVFAFSASALFRCALFCVLLGALGKNGQAPLTMMVFDNLREGPIENIINNYRMTAEIIICHLELQARIMSNRVAMFTGPLETVLETQLGRGLKVLKRSTSFVRRLIAPFMGELTTTYTKEDENYDEADKQLQLIAQRRALGVDLDDNAEKINEQEIANLTNSKPIWTRFKTEFGRRIAHRISKKCNDIFLRGIDKCRELFLGIQDKCYETLPIGINWLVCKRLKMESACQDIDRRRKSFSLCQSHLEKSKIGSGMEGELLEVANLTRELDRETTVSLHTLVVEGPRLEMIYSIHEISLMISHSTAYVKALLSSIKQLIQVLLIYYIYKIFRESVDMIQNYNSDIEYENNFLSSSMWEIDNYRQKRGEKALIRINHVEMKKWKLMNVLGWPTSEEMRKSKHPFYRWIILTFVVSFVIVVDNYLYSFLFKIVSSANTVRESEETAQLKILGQGAVAEFLKNMINIDKTVDIDHVSNEHCLTPPKEPLLSDRIKWLVIPLQMSLIMQVIFSFVIKRIIINFFLPFMFPKRDRIRLIYLYNKLLFLRETARTEARSRIRFTATRWKLNDFHNNSGWLSSKSWLKLNVLDRIFRTGQCIMCEIYMKPAYLRFCRNCPATYCKYCIEEIGGDCYACLAEEGVVDSEDSLPPVIETLEQREFKAALNFKDNIGKATEK